jgi:hypothetical protein
MFGEQMGLLRKSLTEEAHMTEQQIIHLLMALLHVWLAFTH